MNTPNINQAIYKALAEGKHIPSARNGWINENLIDTVEKKEIQPNRFWWYSWFSGDKAPSVGFFLFKDDKAIAGLILKRQKTLRERLSKI